MSNGICNDPFIGNVNYCETENNGLHKDFKNSSYEDWREDAFGNFSPFFSFRDPQDNIAAFIT